MVNVGNQIQPELDRRSALRHLALGATALTALTTSASSLLRNAFIEETSGNAQSPIALEHASCSRAQFTQLIDLSYDVPIEKIERGSHGVRLLPVPGNFVVLNNQRYDLKQIHFHTPSEHTIDGRPAAGEIHFVHKNALGEIAVLGVLLREGRYNPAFQAIFDSLPPSAGEVCSCSARCSPSQLLPENRSAFVYEGSLTTAPYTEGVQWMVMESALEIEGPITDAHTQLGCLGKILGDNHRELQPDNGRLVQLSNLNEL